MSPRLNEHVAWWLPVIHEHPKLSVVEKRALLERLLQEKLRHDRRVPLTSGQHRLWQLQSFEEDNPVLNIALAYQLRGPLDVAAFEQALRELVSRHDSLRTTISVDGGEPIQVIGKDLEIPLIRTEQRSASDADWARYVDEQARSDACLPFDLRQGPLARFRLLSRSENEHAFLITTHHIISDRWSLGILIQQLGTLYTTIALGKEPPNAGPCPQYADFARWQKDWFTKGDFEAQLRFWRERYRGPFTELILPADRQPALAPTFSGQRRQFSVNPVLAAEIATMAVHEGVTPYIVFLAGFAALLHQHSHQREMVVCLPVSGRHHAQSRAIIGYFNNILPVRLDLTGNPTLRQVLERVNHEFMQAFEHQDVPFQQIAELPNLELVPLTRCLFSLQNVGDLDLKLPGIVSRYEDVPTGAADFHLAVFLEEKDDELGGFVDYRSDRFSAQRIDQFVDRYLAVLRRMIDSPDQCLDHLPSYTSAPARTSGSKVSQRTGMQSEEVPARTEQSSAPISRLPRSELERQLIRIWEEVMGIRPIDRDSNFFDLGGHSLLAARLFARIESLLCRSLPLALLLRAPTIKELSNLLTQEDWSPSWSSLGPINPEGSRVPLFLVHAGGGNVISYRRLSDHLGKEQPVWGLQSRGLRAAQDIDSRIEDIAEHYLEAIRFQQPHGPYLLGGHSFGAVVALEMAQKLIAQQESVPLLFIMDHAGPAAKDLWKERIRWNWICLSQLEMRDRPRYLIKGLVYKMRSNSRLPHFVRRIAAGALTGNGGNEKANLRIRQLRSALDSLNSYCIKPYPGKMVLVRGTASHARMYFDRWSGWREVALGGIEVLEIPGHHMNMLEDPQVGVLAEKMKSLLN